MREFLDQLLQIDNIKVGSVEEFQGQERMIIIVSAVRSCREQVELDKKQLVGFLSDPCRMNVSITRARALLIVIGNPHLLSEDVNWRELLIYCLKERTYIGCNLPQSLAQYRYLDLNASVKLYFVLF